MYTNEKYCLANALFLYYCLSGLQKYKAVGPLAAFVDLFWFWFSYFPFEIFLLKYKLAFIYQDIYTNTYYIKFLLHLDVLILFNKYYHSVILLFKYLIYNLVWRLWRTLFLIITVTAIINIFQTFYFYKTQDIIYQLDLSELFSIVIKSSHS